MSVRLLHTSDWHLGRRLYTRTRHDEHAAFLDWLLQTLCDERVDVLLVAGDVFDTGTPGTTAQRLYYQFLARVANTGCRHVVITAGNHDASSFLSAPRELLLALHVHVVGAADTSVDMADEVFVLRRADGQPELVVCAVPYLRESDMRASEAGESLEDKERKLAEGIQEHYARVGTVAKALHECHNVPVVGMGHVFAAGGRTTDNDGVRELYVGSLNRIPTDIFPDIFAYTALGHLHAPQQVNAMSNVRYSGSPLPMSFGEAPQSKHVCLVDVNTHTAPKIRTLDIPVFQRLERLEGNHAAINAHIDTLLLQNPEQSIWLEVTYKSTEPAGSLHEDLAERLRNTHLELLCVKDARVQQRALESTNATELLDDLTPVDVFARCLDAHHISEELRPELTATFDEALHGVADPALHKEF